MSISLTVDVTCGMSIKEAIKEAICLANKIGINIQFEFNDRTVLVFPHTDLDSLLLAYKEAQDNNNTFVCT